MNAGEKMIWYKIKYTAKQRRGLPKRSKKRIVEDILGRPVGIESTELFDGIDPIEIASHLMTNLPGHSPAAA
jgi:hypothetical protein